MALPNFLIVGASKAGTGSLYHYLREHPQVFMSPIKETNYFTFDGRRTRHHSVTTLEEYEALFSGVTTEKAIGEASPGYLRSRIAAEGIKRTIPDARIIISLRDPVDRLYSAFLHWQRNGKAGRDFYEWFEPQAEEANFYLPRLERFFFRFPRERIKVLVFDDMVADTPAVLQDLFSFLGVDRDFEPDTSVVYNQAGTAASLGVSRVIDRLSRLRFAASRWVPVLKRNTGTLARFRRANIGRAQPPPADLRERLVPRFAHDIERTSRLIGRDLSVWLRTETTKRSAAAR